jgi:hypothetical protein
MIGIWILAGVVSIVWARLADVDLDLGGYVIAFAVLAVALLPLSWMRYERPLVPGRHSARRSSAVLGLGCLWAVMAMVIGFALLGLLARE